MSDYGSAGFLLKISIFIFIYFNETLSDGPRMSDTMVKMKAVKDKILNGYDKMIRPTKEGSNTTEVDSAFMPRQILDVDEDKGLFIMDSYIWMTWEDPRLKWNATTEYSGYMQFPVDTLWLPDLTVHNSHSMQIHPSEDVVLVVDSNGMVYWIPPIHTQTSCPDLLRATYPYDTVTCIIEMGSWVHDGWEVDFSHGEHLWMHTFLNINPRWELIVSDVKLVRNFTFYGDTPYVSLNAFFPMKRKSLPQIEATRNPCILIMLLTLSIYWLPTNSSKKVILGGILFLALVILMVYVAWSTRYPLGVVLAVSFLQSTMYIVATTLLLQILVIFNLCNITGPVRPPPAIMQLLTGSFGKYACLRTSFSNDDVPIDRVQLKEDTTPNCIESPSPNEDWKLFAAGLDRLLFVVMSIAMVAVHHL